MKKESKEFWGGFGCVLMMMVVIYFLIYVFA